MVPTPSAHRLQRGLPGYLILFAPHAFVPQRQLLPRDPPSPPVFFLISAHSTATPGIPVSPATLKSAVSKAGPELSSGISLPTRQTAYELFTPNKSGQRLRPTYYRGCWHVVSRRFFCRYSHFRFVPAERGLQPEGRHPSRGVAASGFRPLRNIPTAASRRSLGRVSVPVWPVALSGRLPVVALVGHYPTNKLIGRGPIPSRKTFDLPRCRGR